MNITNIFHIIHKIKFRNLIIGMFFGTLTSAISTDLISLVLSCVFHISILNTTCTLSYYSINMFLKLLPVYSFIIFIVFLLIGLPSFLISTLLGFSNVYIGPIFGFLIGSVCGLGFGVPNNFEAIIFDLSAFGVSGLIGGGVFSRIMSTQLRPAC